MTGRSLAAILFCFCPVLVSAQTPAQIDVVHLVYFPPKFLGAPGQTLQSLQALTASEFSAVKEKATNGDAEAETLLCLAYRVGQFVEQDPKTALIWCQKAADQDNPVAIEELGMLYYTASAEAGTHDPEKAITWLTKAADRGSTSAMDNLGTIYADGLGVTQDYSKALQWYQKSAQAGFVPADYEIGVIYFLGQGVPADVQQGIKLFTKAADGGLPYAMFLLGSVYEEGYGPIKRDQKSALKWFEMCAPLGEAHCSDSLGWAYANGVGVKRDYNEAVKWYGASAQQGDPVGEYGLAVRYMAGQGVPQSISEAMNWFQKAADAGHADAAFNLGAIFANQIPGRQAPPDFISAAKYLAIAASQDISDGQCMLGLLYAGGYGVPQDDVTAYEWAELSQRGSHLCDQDVRALQDRMTPDQLDEAKRRAATFKPVSAPFNISYGNSVPH